MKQVKEEKIVLDNFIMEKSGLDFKTDFIEAVDHAASTEFYEAGKNSFFLYETANQRMERAKNKPIPKKLFGNLWIENEICILFANSNVGKSLLATSIADSISKGNTFLEQQYDSEPQKIALFDFELSDKQFQNRYSIEYDQNYTFSDNFYTSTINYDYNTSGNDQELTDNVYRSIVNFVEKEDVKIIIIDNISYLMDKLEESKNATPLLQNLKALKQKHNLSFLVLAHTPKRDGSKPISENDLAGSKALSNFTDSCFAIGKSSLGESYRYIKQIKIRDGAKEFHEDNILVCELKKIDNYTTFQYHSLDKEYVHLKKPSRSEKKEEKIELVKSLSTEGKSITEIEEITGFSRGSISNYINL